MSSLQRFPLYIINGVPPPYCTLTLICQSDYFSFNSIVYVHVNVYIICCKTKYEKKEDQIKLNKKEKNIFFFYIKNIINYIINSFLVNFITITLSFIKLKPFLISHYFTGN